MPRYRKKPVVIEASQWFANGDHPDDYSRTVEPGPDSTTQFEPFLSEGRVVRRFRRPDVPGDAQCVSDKPCGHTMHDHGWIETLEGGHTVCPGDWIITGVQGKRYPCKPSVFEATYEPAAQAAPGTDADDGLSHVTELARHYHGQLEQLRETAARARESLENTAAGMEMSAATSRPSKKSEIEDSCARAIRAIAAQLPEAEA